MSNFPLLTPFTYFPLLTLQRENEDMRQDNVLLQAKMNNKQRQFEQLKTDHQKLSTEVERNMKASMQVIHWFWGHMVFSVLRNSSWDHFNRILGSFFITFCF